MKQFLTIILRNQFNLYYRFGYAFIAKSQLVEFDGKINDTAQKIIIKQFKTVTPFEYDEEYLILHLEKTSNDKGEFVKFEINDIVSVYPLSQQAKTSIESKIDQRIRLQEPVFEALLPIIEEEIENKEVEKAISALWTICKIDSSLKKYTANIRLENILNGLKHRKDGTKAFKIQKGNYWEYVIAYDRYDHFPSSTLGYFYDAGQVFSFSKGYTTFEGSGLHKFLEKLNSANPEVTFKLIEEALETEEQTKSYVSQTTTSDIKQYIVTPLYLMLRDEIRKSDDISQTKLFKNLDYLKEFGDSFNYVVILLGAFFGFRKFYDIYYGSLNLRFYRDFKAVENKTTTKEQQKKVTDISKTNDMDKNLVQKIKSKNEETTTEILSIKKQKSDNKTEIKKQRIVKQVKNLKLQQDKKESVSNFRTECENIIYQALDECSEIKLSDIVKMIKKQTGSSVKNGYVEKVVIEMDKFKICKIGRSKGIKRKDNNIIFKD